MHSTTCLWAVRVTEPLILVRWVHSKSRQCTVLLCALFVKDTSCSSLKDRFCITIFYANKEGISQRFPTYQEKNFLVGISNV